ncbi:hypothetical protein BKA61DRAFT_490578 [Leptodontidium sp. MPI-SDFR-AT-0119]|nr:hypothetical protein BKA61DRAFT_490578 [Leptodontidium sp. MPI-SDFR-AT-0119]
MGITGLRKSTFISKLVDADVVVGHNLQSCTADVQMFHFLHPSGKHIFLIHTPAYDDTNLTDTQVLTTIAAYLSNMHIQDIRLSGIIYLHRITDMPLGGSALKNLSMFKKLCGEDFYSNIVLVTTMWGNLTSPSLFEEVGIQREKQPLADPKWWRLMSQRGSKVYRHQAERQSALDIVDYLVQRSETAPLLDIEKELVDEKKTLVETSAGQEINKELQEASKKWAKERDDLRNECMQATQDRDEESELMNAKIAQGMKD